MKRYTRLCLVTAAICFSLGLPTFARGDQSGGDSRLRKLLGTYIAPCCWSETLLVHRSPAADEARRQIRDCVEAGWTDEQIKAEMVKTYGKRILAVPEGGEGKVLSIMPWVVLALGASAVGWVIARSLRRPSSSPPPANINLPEIDFD